MASEYLFAPQPQAALGVVGETKLFPVARIFCVGRNYVEHAKEMRNEVDREAPFYFLKSTIGIAHGGATVPYAPGTKDLHHEMELVLAIGPRHATVAYAQAAGRLIRREAAKRSPGAWSHRR